MSRKHYNVIAAALNEDRARFDEDGACQFGVDSAARAIADVLAADNPRFDRERFLTACGVEVER
jgi:hypothetical protein